MYIKTLTYERYLNLLNAIDEHTGSKYEKCWIQNKIFQHYIKEYDIFIAVNARLDVRAFSTYGRKAYYVQKEFRNFMNKKNSKRTD